MANNKCFECGRRYPGCHDRCSEYKAFRELLDKRKGRDTEYQEYTNEVLHKRGKAVTR